MPTAPVRALVDGQAGIRNGLRRLERRVRDLGAAVTTTTHQAHRIGGNGPVVGRSTTMPMVALVAVIRLHDAPLERVELCPSDRVRAAIELTQRLATERVET